MVGIARKNENSAAARLLAPSSIAPTMVEPERETPGIIARHWTRPIFRYIDSGKFVASSCFTSSSSSSTTISTRPPAISDAADQDGVEQHALDEAMQPARRSAPPAGRRSSTPSTKRRAAGSLPQPQRDVEQAAEIDQHDRQDRAELDQHLEGSCRSIRSRGNGRAAAGGRSRTPAGTRSAPRRCRG